MEGTKPAVKKVAKKKVAAKEQDYYIVVYDLVYDGDPVQVCKTLEDAKKFVAKLLTEGDDNHGVDDIVASSVRVYKGKLIGKPKIEIIF